METRGDFVYFGFYFLGSQISLNVESVENFVRFERFQLKSQRSKILNFEEIF